MTGFARWIAAVGMTACLAAAPVSAQAPVDFELRRLAGMHAVATYALGANTACDLFDQGALRALAVLAQAAREALEVDAGPETRDRTNKFSEGQNAWEGCVTRTAAPEAWSLIHNAKILASALIAAPASMSRDPVTCKIAEENRAFDRKVWQFAADVQAAKYRSSPRHTEFEALQSYFAEQADDECALDKRGSRIMQAGFEFIRHADESIIMINFAAPHLPATALRVGAADAVPTLEEHSFWRSRRGEFVPSRTPVNFGIYRIPDKGDRQTISARIVPAVAEGPAGFLLISRGGKWSVRLDKDVRALRLRLVGTDALVPFSRATAEPPVYTFAAPDIDTAMLEKTNASVVPDLQYQDDEGRWTSFAPLSRNQEGDSLRVVDIRTALAWVNAPAMDVGTE